MGGFFEKVRAEIKRLNEYEKKKLRKHLAEIIGIEVSSLNEIKEDIKSKICPRCKSEYIVKNGKYSGKQRYICKECGKTFSQRTNSAIVYSKKTVEQWIKYIECMLRGYSLRRCAKEVKINLSTAFYWRHKIINGLKKVFNKLFIEKSINNINIIKKFLYKIGNLKSLSELKKEYVLKSLKNKLILWIKRFNGIRDKYIRNYLLWFIWMSEIIRKKYILV